MSENHNVMKDFSKSTIFNFAGISKIFTIAIKII